MSCGPDKITNKIINTLSDFIVEPLVYIFNLMVETAIYPAAFKDAIIRPVFKKGDKPLCTNYRPIALTSNLSKIFEKLLKKRIVPFLNKFEIISDRQYGFREDCGTNDVIVNLTTKVYNNLGDDEMIAAIFWIFKKLLIWLDMTFF